ncbi:MAG: chromosomal replication initiator protein DnaA [Proteobacteria bacterium]|nr:MAG: chromosomal replication initiator protein DnaA [Pseudomonadota bacterium]
MQSSFPQSLPSNLVQPETEAAQDTWMRMKDTLRQMIAEDDFKRWIEPLRSKLVSDSELIISFPDMASYQKVLGSYMDQLDYCKATLGLSVLVRFEIEGAGTNDSETLEHLDYFADIAPPPDVYPDTTQPPEDVKESPNTIARALTLQSQLNVEYTFETFVNGPSNQFAHASCLAVADAPGQTYNPLFLYGGTGLGKTHLLHAVGNRVLKARPNAVITYITSERFMNEMIYCLRFNKMWDFRRKYRNCDVLLVDDIQFISGKERTQEEFFHTFNALYESKKQIVVTSDIFPQDIPDIEDRLRNRFQWGLIADIQAPDIEHRVAILMNKAEKQGILLKTEVAEYIATHAKGNIRVLEGALRRVIAFAALQGRPINTQLASEILQDILVDKNDSSISVESIQKIVADHFKLKVADLKSKKRHRALSVPRQIAMYLSRVRTLSSYPEIGGTFGGKDHTTVMHAVKKIEKDRKKDLELRSQLEVLERKLDQIT